MWTPPEDYFVKYFERLNRQFQESIAPLCQGLDARFARQEQFLKDIFVDPMTAMVNSLADHVERMATREEMSQLRSKVTSQVQTTEQLKPSFDTLYHYVYSCCLKPSAGNVIGTLPSLFTYLYSIRSDYILL